MRPSIKGLWCLFAVVVFSPGQLFAQFYSLQTNDLQLIYYTKAHEYVVPHVARCFENALTFHRRLFDYTPSEKVTLILQDFGDFASGGANTVPFNLIGIGISPFNYVYETMPAEERMNLMMSHELVHVVTLDKPSPTDRFFRSLFCGKVAPIPDSPPSMLYAYLTSPRWYAPRWYIESVAVFLETWMAGGLGRALGAYDEMVFRTMVRDSSYIYDVVGLESEGTKVDFQVGANSYLYGTRFVSYLALTFGPEKLIEWFNQTNDSKSYFAAQFIKVYGASLDTEWQKWIGWEHRWQEANLDSIRRFPVTQVRPLSGEALGSVSRSYYDPSSKKLYAAVNYPGQTPHVAAIDIETGSIQKLHDVRGGAVFYVTSLAYDSSSQTLFYSTDNNYWRDLNALDVRTGSSRLLIKDARTGDFTFNASDKSIWGVRHFNGISTLVRIPSPYDEWNQVYSFDYGKDIFDIDISPDGKRCTGALAEVNGRQSLISMDVEKLLNGDATHQVLYDFGNSTPASFVFSRDGKYLFGSSYYSGVSNIVRYDFEQKKMEWVSNCESGLFRPLPLTNDSLVAFQYSGKGFVPVMLANRQVEDVSAIKYLGQEVVESYPVLKSWTLAPPSQSLINLDSLKIGSDEYSPVSNLKLASAYPIVEGYKRIPGYGARLNFSDATLLHSLALSMSYTPNRDLSQAERIHLTLEYSLWQWRFNGTYNGGDFYDLFGPTLTGRKGYSGRLQYTNYLIFEEPETMDYTVSLEGYGGLERLPEFQNVSTTYDKLLRLNAGVTYSNLAKSLGAVDDECGAQWVCVSNTSYANEKLFPRIHSELAYGVLLPINHSSVWLRTSIGYSFGMKGEPLSNFYFGGFGNNWIDHREIRRYREHYSFPGTDLNSVGGTTYGKGMLEWTLPPIRFRRFGVPLLYCTWARFALFSSGIFTNFDRERDIRSLFNVGGQVDFRLVMFSALESTVSIGYAGAIEKDQRVGKEFMVSLKILK